MAVLLLLVLVALIVVAVRLSARGTGRAQLSGHALWSALVDVLLLAGLVVTAIGLAGLLGQLLARLGVGGTVLAGDSVEAARNAALVTVGLPVVAALGATQRRALRTDPQERDRPAWTLCVTAAALTSLLVAMTSADQCLGWLFGTEPAAPRALGRFVVWSLVWGLTWWIDRAVTPAARRQPHLLLGSLLGLAYAAVGLATLLGGTATQLLGLQVDAPADPADAALRGLAALAVGVPVWLLYWWRTARDGPRTRAWLAYLVLTGPVGAAVAALVGAVVAIDALLVWFLGTPDAARAEVHFRSTPYAVATVAVGLLVLRYHDRLLRTVVDRRDAVRRVRAYLLCAIGLVATAVGTGMLVTAALDAATRSAAPRSAAARSAAVVSDPADTALLAAALLVVALPLWTSTWWSVQRTCRADPGREQPAMSRRLYLAGLTGTGSLVALGALVATVYLLFADLFAGTLTLATLRGMRYALAVLVPAVLVAGYHAVLVRAERGAAPGGRHPRPGSVVLGGPRDPFRAHQVPRAVGVPAEPRPRTDVTTRTDVMTSTPGGIMRPTEPFRREHEELSSHITHLGHAAREVARLDLAEREQLVGRLLDFLRGTLLPHAQAEEAVLYPAWADLVGYADASVPMVHDHHAILERVERLEQADVADVDTLQELLYGLHALISVHFRKEEDIQLPAFDAAPAEVTESVLARMGSAPGHAHH